MTELLNYTLGGNITSFPDAINYTNTVISQSSLGFVGFFGPMALLLSFVAFYAISSRYTSDRSLPYSIFMTIIVATLLSSAALLDPMYIIYCVILLAAVVYYGGIET